MIYGTRRQQRTELAVQDPFLKMSVLIAVKTKIVDVRVKTTTRTPRDLYADTDVEQQDAPLALLKYNFFISSKNVDVPSTVAYLGLKDKANDLYTHQINGCANGVVMNL